MQPFPWNYSSLNTFATCPAQYHARKVTKTAADVKGEAARYGDYVHKQFENRQRDGTPLPADLAHHEEYMQVLSGLPGERLIEGKLAIDRTLQPCKFFDRYVWARGIIDFAAIEGDTARIVDYKTGKRLPTPDQMKLCSLLVFATYKQVKKCSCAYYMTQLPEGQRLVTHSFHREESAKLWQKFVPNLVQYVEAFHTDIWQERQSGLCRGWCPVKQCAYWTPKPNA